MIRSVSIKNFLGINELVDLKLGLGPTFLIGQNGSGKSTFISAIHLTQKLIKYKNADFVLSSLAPFGGEISSHGNSRDTEFVFCIKSKKGFYRFSYSIRSEREGFVIPREKLEKINDEYRVESLVYERLSDGIKTSNESTIPLHVNRNELVLSGYNEEFTRDVANTLSSCRVLWLNGRNDDHSFHIYRKDELHPTSLDAMAVRLYKTDKEAFNNAVKVIQTIIPTFLPPNIQEISPNKAVDSDETRYVVFWNEKWNDDSILEYVLPVLSDGNMRVIQLIFSIFASEMSTCILGEELENGQHFGRIKTLLETITTLAIKRNIQMIFTTHSIELLSFVPPSHVIYLDKDEHGYTRFRELDKKVNLAYIEQELGREPSSKDLMDLGII